MAENVVFVIKKDGKGAIYKYTEERYKKFEENIKKSGFRKATMEEIKSKFSVKPVENTASEPVKADKKSKAKESPQETSQSENQDS